MGRYIIRRILGIIPLLLGITVISFIIMELAPGDFLSNLKLNPQISPESIEQMRKNFGLDQPWYVRYWMWLRNILFRLDFGHSFAFHIPVWDLIKPRMWNTFLLSVSGAVIGWLLAIPLGVYGAVKQHSLGDRLLTFFSYLGVAVPSFFAALLLLFIALAAKLTELNEVQGVLINVALCVTVLALCLTPRDASAWNKDENDKFFSRHIKALLKVGLVTFSLTYLIGTSFFVALRWFNLPMGGMQSPDYMFISSWSRFIDLLRHLLIPATVLGIGSIAYLMRQMRANLLDVLRAEYITTARAKGLPENVVIWKHGVRNAVNPLITIFGFELGSLFSGALMVEILTAWPGLGRLMYEAILQKDQYVVMGDLILSAAMLIAGNLIADILLAVSDPRIKYE